MKRRDDQNIPPEHDHSLPTPHPVAPEVAIELSSCLDKDATQIFKKGVMDALDGDRGAQADHVRHGGLVVTARQQPPGEQAADNEQEKEQQPEPPVALGRRTGRLGDLFGRRRRRQQAADGLVDPRGTSAAAAAAAAVDPVQPVALPFGRKRGESIARLRDAVQRGGYIGWELRADRH